MLISGTGVTPFNAKIKPGFKPMTDIAITWKQLSNGNYVAVDRTSSTDTYETQLSLYGTETVIDTFLQEINNNRTADDNVLTLSGFNATESVFGANVDHSGSINATVIEISQKQQNTWKGFSLSVRFRALSPTFTGDSESLPLTNMQYGFVGDSDRTINKTDSYTGSFTYLDRESDIGKFTGTFMLTNANMVIHRNRIRTIRGGTHAITSIGGVASLFGPRRGGYPHNVKIIDWQDLGMRDVDRWLVRLTMAEHV